VDVDCLAISAGCVLLADFAAAAHETTQGHALLLQEIQDGGRSRVLRRRRAEAGVCGLKTVCSNGTSGFLVVAPSENKRWVMPLGPDELPKI
jgi:hypothetical protein